MLPGVLAGALAAGAAGEAVHAIEPDLTPGAMVRIESVVDGDTVRLAKPVGRSREIRLVGIQTPKPPLGRPHIRSWPLADRAKAALEELTLGRELVLAFGGERLDRHGRLLAHLYTPNDFWIQGELLRRGLARVYTLPDNRAAVPAMLDREREARATRRGIWRTRFYRVRRAEDAGRHIGSFQIVEDRIVAAAIVKGRAYLNFSPDWRTDFTISIAPKWMRLFKSSGIDVTSLSGKTIRVRGWLKSFNGPMIEVTHPEQIEIVGK